MSIHCTTFVIPDAVMGLPHDTLVIVLRAKSAEESGTNPAVTSLHRVGNHVVPFSHSSMLLGGTRVTDI
ncbi:hypothetical protein [Streptomyces sp. MH60]|uniref:hypothetical protein n=1 Tax=Streptomyces sp. MH60 TaxID=1940758 RepID=UPI000CEE17DB|nr:hypothetical protein [Streptomyces sp. MH60]PPS91480.1 hypothetical protein BZZ08_00360 [Streptomyces sp. MH60]